ncbi:MAG: hypothetical protein CM15mP120_02910 [Pseudomonadota bacterium]|nr:MAG: hypothetical protein CM15mP120_02910 [Pseudomonadota bacterium]
MDWICCSAGRKNQWQMDYVALGTADQVALLEQLEEGRGQRLCAVERTHGGWLLLSEVGVKQERQYVPIPGYYDGYYKLSKVGKQWSS